MRCKFDTSIKMQIYYISLKYGFLFFNRPELGRWKKGLVGFFLGVDNQYNSLIFRLQLVDLQL